MKTRWFVLILALALLPAAAGAAPTAQPTAQPAELCSAQNGFLEQQSPASDLFAPDPSPAGSCPLYHRCICRCNQEGICCRNGCQSQPNVSTCTNQCYEAEHACEDECIARYVSDGTICENTNCSLNPFCNAP